jgi:hypothetical protein
MDGSEERGGGRGAAPRCSADRCIEEGRAREAVDLGGRKVGRGREEGGRWQRGESEAARQGGGGGRREGCAWWRSGGGGLGLVESIYINITMNVDRPIARSTAPSDRGVGGLT